MGKFFSQYVEERRLYKRQRQIDQHLGVSRPWFGLIGWLIRGGYAALLAGMFLWMYTRR